MTQAPVYLTPITVTDDYGHTVTVPGPWRTVEQIRRANERIGNHWFAPDTLRFFRCRVSQVLIAGRFFVSSELRWGDRARSYTIRAANDDGSITTIGELCGYSSLASAQAAARKLARG